MDLIGVEQEPVCIQHADEDGSVGMLERLLLHSILIRPRHDLPAPMLRSVRAAAVRILQVSALARETITQQAHKELLRGFLSQGLGMLAGKVQQDDSRLLQPILRDIPCQYLVRYREVEKRFYAEQKMGDLSGFSAVAPDL